MRKWSCWMLKFVAVVLAAGMVSLAGAALPVQAQSIVEYALSPWDGHGSTAGEGAGPAANPAAHIGLKNPALSVQVMRAAEDKPLPDGIAVVYHEPDDGLGSGQLAFLSLSAADDKVTRFVYSGAKPLGSAAAFGFGITHTRRESGTPGDSFGAWGLDVGFLGSLSDQLTVGATVRNGLLYGDPKAKEQMPPNLAAGFALQMGPVTLFGDWLFEGAAAPFKQGYAYGVETNLGRLLLRFGERNFPDAMAKYVSYGLGYRLNFGRVDLALNDGPDGRLLVLGVSFQF